MVLPADAERFWRPGHFRYESGDHGDRWLALGLLFSDPRRLHRAARRLAALLVVHEPALICGPLVGGALVGHWVAHELALPFVYAEPVTERRETTPPRYALPNELRPLVAGSRVALVDDALNAGAATLAAGREVERAGGTVVAVAALVGRLPSIAPLLEKRAIALEILLPLEWNTWPPSQCPLCQAGAPIDDI